MGQAGETSSDDSMVDAVATVTPSLYATDLYLAMDKGVKYCISKELQITETCTMDTCTEPMVNPEGILSAHTHDFALRLHSEMVRVFTNSGHKPENLSICAVAEWIKAVAFEAMKLSNRKVPCSIPSRVKGLGLGACDSNSVLDKNASDSVSDSAASHAKLVLQPEVQGFYTWFMSNETVDILHCAYKA
ncbi:hypothetical protein HOLleu_21070 [Holothuria leucospilota]|uniref:Uncharacterized protein n=1 Tax=Holothuria leucospilota TaxID=206669 RepID=A0A9Q1BVX4_HOLLE|nr:hypothetical protein HOLleu_21070 [Holothuria leucospilota]